MPAQPSVDRPDRRARRSTSVLAAAAVLIAAARVLVGALVFGRGDDAATGDLDQACALLRESDVDRLADLDGFEDPDLWRLFAVSSLFQAAGYAEGDDGLVEVGRQLDAARARFDDEQFAAALDDSGQVCE